MARDNMNNDRRGRSPATENYIERVVAINRVAKVMKGGRRFSFSALVVVGDGQGRVGVALGKAREVPEAIRKGKDKAIKAMFRVPMIDATIPHEIIGHHGAGRVLLRPASEGTGVIAGGAVRAIIEAAGISDVLTKCLGTTNAINVAHATVDALTNLTSLESVANRRKMTLEDIQGRHVAR